MARELDKRPCQPALAVPRAQDALPARAGHVRVGVARREERLARLRLEAHLPAPRHVLDGEQGPVGEEDHVHGAVGDLDVARAVDDVGDRTVRGRVRAVAAREDGLLGADGPVHFGGRVDRLFDVCPVEVDLAAWGDVVYRGGEAQDVVWDREELADLVCWTSVLQLLLKLGKSKQLWYELWGIVLGEEY